MSPHPTVVKRLKLSISKERKDKRLAIDLPPHKYVWQNASIQQSVRARRQQLLPLNSNLFNSKRSFRKSDSVAGESTRKRNCVCHFPTAFLAMPNPTNGTSPTYVKDR